MMTYLGRIALHDPRSREHEAPVRKVSTRRNVRHAMNAPHVDQFYLGGCVGFSGTNMQNCAAAVRSRRRWNEVFGPRKTRSSRYLDNNDGIDNYSGATENDPFPWTYPPTDEGSSAIGLMKYWKKYSIISSYSWTFTFDQFLATLQRQPVLVGTMWYDDMMSTNDDGIIRSRAGGGGGGHEYLGSEIIWAGTRAYGRLWKETHIGHEQSWGEHPPNFGIDGRFWMPASLSEELIIHQGGDVAVPSFL